MKRLIALILLMANLLAFSSCTPTDDSDGSDTEEPHTCEFDIESPKAKYIKNRSTCTQLAEYYYSCSCGEAGTQTFYYGDYAGHVYMKNVQDIYLA